MIRRFVQALARGYESARSDPTAAVQNLVKANPGLDHEAPARERARDAAGVLPDRSGHPWGWQDPSQWNAYGQWMLNHHLISNPDALSEPLPTSCSRVRASAERDGSDSLRVALLEGRGGGRQVTDPDVVVEDLRG